MRKIVFVLFVVTSLQNAFSQDFELINHQVQLGETVRMISKKYKVEPAEIYRLNKFAVDGIKQGMVIRLFVPMKETPKVQSQDEAVAPQSNDAAPVADIAPPAPKESSGEEVTHTVVKGETLYKLSKMYDVTVDDITALNGQALKNGMQTGQVLIIKSGKK